MDEKTLFDPVPSPGPQSAGWIAAWTMAALIAAGILRETVRVRRP